MHKLWFLSIPDGLSTWKFQFFPSNYKTVDQIWWTYSSDPRERQINFLMPILSYRNLFVCFLECIYRALNIRVKINDFSYLLHRFTFCSCFKLSSITWRPFLNQMLHFIILLTALMLFHILSPWYWLFWQKLIVLLFLKNVLQLFFLDFLKSFFDFHMLFFAFHKTLVGYSIDIFPPFLRVFVNKFVSISWFASFFSVLFIGVLRD